MKIENGLAVLPSHNNSQTRREKRIKRIKTFINTIKMFIDILDRTLEICLLRL